MQSKSTVHAVVDRLGLVAHARKGQRFRGEATALAHPLLPNDLWCAAFEGESILICLREGRFGHGRHSYSPPGLGPKAVECHFRKALNAVIGLHQFLRYEVGMIKASSTPYIVLPR